MELGELERLRGRHEVAGFDAGPADIGGQTAWLRDRALANDQLGLTRVFVATLAGTPRVGAFFGLAPSVVVRAELPRRLRPHGMPPTIPAWLIARLAVDRSLQGKGIGRDLMLAALSRALIAHEHGGGALVIVDAVGDRAKQLYAHHRFVPITDAVGDTTRMIVPMATVGDLLRTP